MLLWPHACGAGLSDVIEVIHARCEDVVLPEGVRPPPSHCAFPRHPCTFTKAPAPLRMRMHEEPLRIHKGSPPLPPRALYMKTHHALLNIWLAVSLRREKNVGLESAGLDAPPRPPCLLPSDIR